MATSFARYALPLAVLCSMALSSCIIQERGRRGYHDHDRGYYHDGRRGY
ncbi:hypothetical protein [Hymenobacter baengnokdamensis]|nr:hypothetical protein [Hymenobacter baengnokdamensis]